MAVTDLEDRLAKFMLVCKEVMSLELAGAALKEEAFISICDLLIVFGHCGEQASQAQLKPLQYKPDQAMGTVLNIFVQDHVFIDDDDEEIDDHQKIEELHKRRNFLASYCKLVVYSVLPTKSAADVLKHYVTFYNDYGDIIKATLGKARENNKTNCAKTMIQSLIYKFNELQQETGEIERSSEEFHSIKELAKRFSLSFGLDALKNREAVASLHRYRGALIHSCTLLILILPGTRELIHTRVHFSTIVHSTCMHSPLLNIPLFHVYALPYSTCIHSICQLVHIFSNPPLVHIHEHTCLFH